MLLKTVQIFFFTAFFFSNCFSQSTNLIETIKGKYPDESIVQLTSAVNIDISLAGDKLKVSEKFDEESILLKDDASSYSTYSVFSNSMVKLASFTCKTKVPKGSSYKSIDNENIETVNDLGSSSFYDDQKKHTVHMNNLQKGSIRKINYEVNYEDAHFFGSYPLWNYIPTENIEVKIKCAKNIELETKCVNCNESIGNITVTDEGKYKLYSLTLKNQPKNKTFNGSPNYRWYLPHLLMRVKSYNTSTGSVSYLNDVSDLYKWYSGLVKNLPHLNSPELMKITDSLVKDVKEEREKVKNVFKWVQKNIKYVAFEDGMGGYVPRDPSLVFQKKYGDCKDMAFLIYSMLNHAGVKSYLTWIGTRSLPYTYSKHPSPLINDHMIACYLDEKKKPIFLDATDKYINFGFPSAFTQGKQGLLGEQEKFIDTIFVPVIPANRNVKTDSCFLKIEDQKLSGKCKIFFTGYKRVDFLGDISTRKLQNLDDYYHKEFIKGHNKFFQSNIDLKKELNDSTAFLGFDFSVNDYVKKINKEVYINLNIEDDLPLYVFQDAYTTPYEIDFSYTNKYVKVLEIPANYKVSYLPENYSAVNSDYEIKINYEVKGNTIINTLTFVVNPLLVEHKDLHKWNTFINGINQQRNNTVTLELKN